MKKCKKRWMVLKLNKQVIFYFVIILSIGIKKVTINKFLQLARKRNKWDKIWFEKSINWYGAPKY
jgi:hypothetical protein